MRIIPKLFQRAGNQRSAKLALGEQRGVTEPRRQQLEVMASSLQRGTWSCQAHTSEQEPRVHGERGVRGSQTSGGSETPLSRQAQPFSPSTVTWHTGLLSPRCPGAPHRKRRMSERGAARGRGGFLSPPAPAPARSAPSRGGLAA